MSLKKLFLTLFLLVTLMPVTAIAVPFMEITGGTPKVFTNSDFEQIPEGETRVGTVASIGNFVNLEIPIYTDVFTKVFYSKGVDGNFLEGGTELQLVTSGLQTLLSSSSDSGGVSYLSAGTNLFMQQVDYGVGGGSFASGFIGNNVISSTMEIIPLNEQVLAFLIDIDGQKGDDGLNFFISAHPIPEQEKVFEPTMLSLLSIGLLGMVFTKRLT
ncbi:MAG: hypothetical protein R3B60_02285 [Candidatus Paceibacterota bacterium]